MAIDKEKYKGDNGVFYKVSGRQSKMTIGFEWEIPFQPRDPRPLGTFRLCEEMLSGFPGRVYYDCRALEIASPVFTNIAEARSFASHLKKDVRKRMKRFVRLRPRGGSHANGIHVHVTVPYSSGIVKERVELIMNRASSKEFIWRVSGRSPGAAYSNQAVSNCWDKGGTRGNNMVRLNVQNGVRTIEYRLFNSHEDRLEIALEFSHAMTKFSHQSLPSEVVPTIQDFKTWVEKQRGYTTLKNFMKGEKK